MVYDANEVVRLLNDQAERFCAQFLSKGRKIGHEWRCSDILCTGESKGKSFAVELTGNKKGLWYENGTPVAGEKGGSLIDILIVQRNCNFPEAIKFAKSWLGLHDEAPKIKYPSEKNKTPASEFISTKHLTRAKEGSPAWEYLTKERGIAPEIIAK